MAKFKQVYVTAVNTTASPSAAPHPASLSTPAPAMLTPSAPPAALSEAPSTIASGSSAMPADDKEMVTIPAQDLREILKILSDLPPAATTEAAAKRDLITGKLNNVLFNNTVRSGTASSISSKFGSPLIQSSRQPAQTGDESISATQISNATRRKVSPSPT